MTKMVATGLPSLKLKQSCRLFSRAREKRAGFLCFLVKIFSFFDGQPTLPEILLTAVIQFWESIHGSAMPGSVTSCRLTRAIGAQAEDIQEPSQRKHHSIPSTASVFAHAVAKY